MVNYFENDQAIPIILGDCKEAIAAAKQIRNNSSLKVTILSKKLSLLNKIRFTHRIPSSLKDEIVLLTLEDIAKETQEYSMPLLIYCAEHNKDFISKYHSKLEHLYVIIPAQEIKTYFEGT